MEHKPEARQGEEKPGRAYAVCGSVRQEDYENEQELTGKISPKQEGEVMARDYVSTEAMCPFYRMESAKQVTCEGLRPGWTIILRKNGTSGSAKGFIKKFCYRNWKDCPVAEMLYREKA